MDWLDFQIHSLLFLFCKYRICQSDFYLAGLLASFTWILNVPGFLCVLCTVKLLMTYGGPNSMSDICEKLKGLELP